MKITILCVGKIKEKYLVQALEEYKKRLQRYCELEIVEVADEQTREQASDKETRLIKDKEGERIQKYIKEDGYVIALAIEGKMLDSFAFSEKIEQLGIQGTSHIYLIIGGSLGLSQEVLRRADFLLSFSPMTFPHQLMRVILLEQIYRAYRIMKHEPYHK